MLVRGLRGLNGSAAVPEDYDGIVAGMPANNWTRLMAGDFDAALATFKGVSTTFRRPRWVCCTGRPYQAATAKTASSTACSMIRAGVRSIRQVVVQGQGAG